MNSSQEILQNAQNLNYHYVVVRAVEAMKKHSKGLLLDEEDQHYLLKAESLLKKIANGKSIAEKGKVSKGANPVQSMKALRLAGSSLKYLEATVGKDANTAQYINNMAEVIHDVANNEKNINESLASPITKFFEYLGGSFSSTIHQSQREYQRSRFELA